MLQSGMSEGWKIFSGFALVLLIFLGFVLFIRGQFEDGSGLDLPLLAVPLKYEVNLENSPRKYIVFVTLPALAISNLTGQMKDNGPT